MSRYNDMSLRLENMISALEKMILEAKDEEILTKGQGEEHAVSDARTLVEKQLLKYKQSLKPVVKNVKRIVRADVMNAPRVPRDVAGRLQLLRKLLTTRPDLTPRLSSAFSAGRNPSDQEVNKLTEELIRMGVLKHKDHNHE